MFCTLVLVKQMMTTHYLHTQYVLCVCVYMHTNRQLDSYYKGSNHNNVYHNSPYMWQLAFKCLSIVKYARSTSKTLIYFQYCQKFDNNHNSSR